jgi:hypothetical protein
MLSVEGTLNGMAFKASLGSASDAGEHDTGNPSQTPREPCDTFTLGWQIEVLRSGNMAYLEIERSTVLKATRFLDSVQADAGATYGSSDSLKPEAAASAVGLACRMKMGWKRDNPAFEDGVARMAKLGPTDDLVYDFCVTSIMKHMEHDIWVPWHERLKERLLVNQANEGHEAGSWSDGVSGGSSFRGGRLGCRAGAEHEDDGCRQSYAGGHDSIMGRQRCELLGRRGAPRAA